MNITLERSDSGAFLKIRRNDGKWARVEMSAEAVRSLHQDILSVYPELAVHEDIKRAIEHLNETINKFDPAKADSTENDKTS